MAAGLGWTCAPSQGPQFHFTPAERRLLENLLRALIPSDEQPGAIEAGGVEYIELLLNALVFDTPRLFGGGPFSGRHGGDRSFEKFVPLSRIEELAWRTRIEGSQGRPEREFNGPTRGYRAMYAEGLARLEEAARARQGASAEALSPEGALDLLSEVDPELRGLLYEHAVEAMYGDPVYGGNLGSVGWASIGYEGDRQPAGYLPDEVST